MDTGIGGRARRVLAVLAVVLGVLAMHGLASGHHGSVPALPALTSASSTAAAVDQQAAGAAEHAAKHTQTAGPAAAVLPLHDVLAGGCHGDCGEHPSGLVLLCAAVLLAAAGAFVVVLGRRAWRAVPATGPPAGTLPRTTAPPRRPDLVADLCVSRT